MAAVVIGHLPLGIVGLIFAGLPKFDSLIFLILSVTFHFFYQFFLLNSYRYGELTFVYPIARGFSPLLLTIYSVFFFSEKLSEKEVIGIIIVSFSIMIIGIVNIVKYKVDLKTLLFATITGFFISLYSMADGMGARINEDAISYYSMMTIANGIVFAIFIKIFHPLKFKNVFFEGRNVFIIGGSASYIAYLIVVWACISTPIAIVSSLRECSVIFALILGIFFLKEKFTLVKLIMTIGIFFGIVLMKIN